MNWKFKVSAPLTLTARLHCIKVVKFESMVTH